MDYPYFIHKNPPFRMEKNPSPSRQAGNLSGYEPVDLRGAGMFSQDEVDLHLSMAKCKK